MILQSSRCFEVHSNSWLSDLKVGKATEILQGKEIHDLSRQKEKVIHGVTVNIKNKSRKYFMIFGDPFINCFSSTFDWYKCLNLLHLLYLRLQKFEYVSWVLHCCLSSLMFYRLIIENSFCTDGGI